jgi:hypothetical protein
MIAGLEPTPNGTPCSRRIDSKRRRGRRHPSRSSVESKAQPPGFECIPYVATVVSDHWDDLGIAERLSGVHCYANCDGSTAAPVLTVSDFTCFLNLYAAGDTWANCDGSSVAPVLGVNDFVCFQALYAAGCSAP